MSIVFDRVDPACTNDNGSRDRSGNNMGGIERDLLSIGLHTIIRTGSEPLLCLNTRGSGQ